MSKEKIKHKKSLPSVMLLCPILGLIIVSALLILEPLGSVFPSKKAITPADGLSGLPEYTELHVTVRYGMLGTLCEDCRVTVFSSDLHTCYGTCPCKVTPGETVLIAVSPCAADLDLTFDYHFPSGTDGDLIELEVPNDGMSVIRLSAYNRSSSVYGYVTDMNGTPVEGAVVTLVSDIGGRSACSVHTDVFGSYIFRDVASGADAEIFVSAPGLDSCSCVIGSDVLLPETRVRQNISVGPYEPDFTVKLINSWSDPRIGDLLLERFAESSILVTDADSYALSGVFTFDSPACASYRLYAPGSGIRSFKVSSSCRFFPLSSRTVRSGGTIELTAEDTGCVKAAVQSSSKGPGSAADSAAVPDKFLFCLYDSDGRLADSMISSGSASLFAPSGDYMFICYPESIGLYSTIADVNEYVNDYYHVTVSVSSGRICDLGYVTVPYIPMDFYGGASVTLPDGSSVPVTKPSEVVSSNGEEFITMDITPGADGYLLVSGTSLPFRQIFVTEEDIILGTVVSDAYGRWSIRISPPGCGTDLHSHALTAVTCSVHTAEIPVIHDAVSDLRTAVTVKEDGVSLGTSFNFNFRSEYTFEAVADESSDCVSPAFSLLLENGDTMTVSAHADLSRALSRTSHITYVSDSVAFSESSSVPVKAFFTSTSEGVSRIIAVQDFKVLSTPTGYVYEAVASNRKAGSAVTVFDEGLVLSDLSRYGETNPLYTDRDGCFYTTAEGPLFIRANSTECVGSSTHSDPASVLTIDGVNYLPSTDVPGGLSIPVTSVYPAHAGLIREKGRIILEFDRYVFVNTVTADNISVLLGGYLLDTYASSLLSAGAYMPSSVRVTALDAELSPDGTPICGGHLLARRFMLTFNVPIGLLPVDVILSDRVLTYNGLPASGTFVSEVGTVQKILGIAVPILACLLLLYILCLIYASALRRRLRKHRLAWIRL